MTLLLDCGNTRIKWGLLENGGLLASGAFNHADSNVPNELEQVVSDGRVEHVYASNVAGDRVRQLLQEWSDKRQIELKFAQSGPSFCGLKNGYAQPETLGVDRWLALIATYQRYADSPCLVVDCGSAITVDVINGQGTHMGGTISPGLRLLQQALVQGTALVVQEGMQQEQWPTVSADAIQTGCRLAAIGGIQQAINRFRQQFGASGKVVLTGGDAGQLLDGLSEPVVLDPWLVLKGLAMVADGQLSDIVIALRSP